MANSSGQDSFDLNKPYEVMIDSHEKGGPDLCSLDNQIMTRKVTIIHFCHSLSPCSVDACNHLICILYGRGSVGWEAQ